jgi:hypothetical protein
VLAIQNDFSTREYLLELVSLGGTNRGTAEMCDWIWRFLQVFIHCDQRNKSYGWNVSSIFGGGGQLEHNYWIYPTIHVFLPSLCKFRHLRWCVASLSPMLSVNQPNSRNRSSFWMTWRVEVTFSSLASINRRTFCPKFCYVSNSLHRPRHSSGG